MSKNRGTSYHLNSIMSNFIFGATVEQSWGHCLQGRFYKIIAQSSKTLVLSFINILKL